MMAADDGSTMNLSVGVTTVANRHARVEKEFLLSNA
jgi:hypothetical protein